MIFNSVTLNNFGPYRGIHEFDLRPKHENGHIKPILLFGGKNGAGKTNLFDAITLCLYGPLSIGNATSRKEYEEYLFEKIHRSGKTTNLLNQASVKLEVTHAHLGIIDNYQIERKWNKNGSKIKEDILVHQNGELLRDLSSDQWESFIKELIPPIIAQIFFFDGEKIRKLSGDRSTDNIYLSDSIKSLLGIDITERLFSDLIIYQKKFTEQSHDESSYLIEIEKLQSQREEADEQLSSYNQKRAEIENKIGRCAAQIQKIEDKLSSLGGEFFSKREALKAEEIKLKIEIEDIENKIRELCHRLFPFALCIELCEKLNQRLQDEQVYLKNVANREYADELIKNLRAMIINSFVQINEDQRQFLDKIFMKLEAAAQEMSGNELVLSDASLIHELSMIEIEKIQSWIDEVRISVPATVSKLRGELKTRLNRLFDVENDLIRSPSEDILKPHIEELNLKNQELGSFKQEALQYDEKISSMTYQIQQIDIGLRKLNQTILDSKQYSEKQKLIAGTQEVLMDFANVLRQKKIVEFEETILALFNKLCRKEDLISKIKVDPSDLTIDIYDADNKKMAKKSLSSGERQIFAIAILWALKKISNRPIPVIIDTPLSRLDSDHRKSLIYTFFPHVSHQTIILSTDTEVNKGYFKDLSEYISHSYHLKYDKKEKMTHVKPGYFN